MKRISYFLTAALMLAACEDEMHRTNADNHVNHLFVDVVAGVSPGTTDSAVDANAWQEELSNVVEMTGGTLAADGAADETAGWHQVYDAIFSGENIETAALADGAVTGDKIAYPVEADTGGYYLRLDQAGLLYTHPGSGAEAQSSIAGFRSLNSGLQTVLKGQGLRYSTGPGTSVAFKAVHLRKAAYDVEEEGEWTETSSGSGVWEAQSALVTDIPDSVGASGVYSLSVRYNQTQGGFIVCPTSAYVSASGGFLRLSSITVHGSPGHAPGTFYVIVVEYDASTVTVS